MRLRWRAQDSRSSSLLRRLGVIIALFFYTYNSYNLTVTVNSSGVGGIAGGSSVTVGVPRGGHPF